MSGHGPLLTIDLGALARNWRRLREEASGAECAAAVKADAYGIGIGEAARPLWDTGCRTFFVAHLSEGIRLRGLLPSATIYVLNGLAPESEATLAGNDLRPVLGSREDVSAWAAFCREAGQLRPAALHVDTGINRLGIPTPEVAAVVASPDLAEFRPTLLMSHFASSEIADDPTNAEQIACFAAARSAFPDLPASLANSSGIFLPEGPNYAMVRPGYALYGGNPRPGLRNPMEPVVRLEASVIQVRDVDRGARVGYGGRWTAPGPRRLATLSIGYADGVPRAASGRAGHEGGAALVAGHLCPFVGTVSMDLIVIDATGVPDGAVGRGSPAVIIGDALDLDTVAARAGTVGYEILTNLSRRAERRYVNG